MPENRENPTTTDLELARHAYRARHRAADAQWLADDLYRRAERGDRRARRLLAWLARRFAEAGANVPEPSWPDIASPERRAELAS